MIAGWQPDRPNVHLHGQSQERAKVWRHAVDLEDTACRKEIWLAASEHCPASFDCSHAGVVLCGFPERRQVPMKTGSTHV